MGNIYPAYNLDRMNAAIAEREGKSHPALVKVMEAIRNLEIAVDECEATQYAGHLIVRYDIGGDDSRSVSIKHLNLCIERVIDDSSYAATLLEEKACNRKAAVTATKAKSS